MIVLQLCSCFLHECVHCSSQHLYSITSSARASSVGGTSRPSALAVFTLIVSSYLTGALRRQISGILTLEDAIDVGRRAADDVERVGSVGHQGAFGDELSKTVDRRQAMALRQRHNQRTVGVCERGPRNDQPSARPACKCRD